MTIEIYRANVPDWADSLELVVVPAESTSIEVLVEERSKFLIGVVASPDGDILRRQNGFARLIVREPGKGRLYEGPENTERLFLSGKEEGPGLIVINEPSSGSWTMIADRMGLFPFSINIMVFHPPANYAGLTSPPQLPLGWKCRACKMTAKALALAIVAGLAMSFFPASTAAAVAAFLGVKLPIATAFIASVMGDSASAITEKLCKLVGLC
jgi:hypothetical protein